MDARKHTLLLEASMESNKGSRFPYSSSNIREPMIEESILNALLTGECSSQELDETIRRSSPSSYHKSLIKDAISEYIESGLIKYDKKKKIYKLQNHV